MHQSWRLWDAAQESKSAPTWDTVAPISRPMQARAIRFPSRSLPPFLPSPPSPPLLPIDDAFRCTIRLCSLPPRSLVCHSDGVPYDAAGADAVQVVMADVVQPTRERAVIADAMAAYRLSLVAFVADRELYGNAAVSSMLTRGTELRLAESPEAAVASYAACIRQQLAAALYDGGDGSGAAAPSVGASEAVAANRAAAGGVSVPFHRLTLLWSVRVKRRKSDRINGDGSGTEMGTA